MVRVRKLNSKALTYDQKIAAGRSLRDKTGRTMHAGWKAPARRIDPVQILIDSSEGRMPELVPIRYTRMMQNPFAFYRGAAAIMAADLAHTPVSGIRVQACGDCHLMNFGAFATPERRVVFDINDFDETLPAPWEWDVKRLAASFVIAARHNKFHKWDAKNAASKCVQSYRKHMLDFSKMAVLDRWYARIDIEDLIAKLYDRSVRKRIQKRLEKESARTVVEHDFPKLAILKAGKPRIKDNPPTIFHLPESDHAAFQKVLVNAFQEYVETLSDDRKALLSHFEMHDFAIKVVGVGSVGTRCGILLLGAGNNDPLFLQVKEARYSVLERYAGKSVYSNRGERVVNGQRLMQSASDLFLGWTEARDGRHFYVRQLRDMKISPMVELFEEDTLAQYAEFCGWALARAHAKSGDAAMISGYIGNSDRFDQAVASFAVDYADQNEKDHDSLLIAIRAGKIEIARE